MESLTYMKSIPVSTKKMRLLLPAIKKHTPQQALDFVMYTRSKEGRFYYKAIQSAINNAVQTLKVGADVLQFRLFTIEEGRSLKRHLPGSRGGVKPIKKPFSHIKIVIVAGQEQSDVKAKLDQPVSQVVNKSEKIAKSKSVTKKTASPKKLKVSSKKIKVTSDSKE